MCGVFSIASVWKTREFNIIIIRISASNVNSQPLKYCIVLSLLSAATLFTATGQHTACTRRSQQYSMFFSTRVYESGHCVCFLIYTIFHTHLIHLIENAKLLLLLLHQPEHPLTFHAKPRRGLCWLLGCLIDFQHSQRQRRQSERA